MSKKFELIAKTFQGIEEELATEIEALGGEDIEIGRRMVSFKGDKELMYKANFFCRTALRILKPVYSFKATDTDELYAKIKEFDWQTIITPKGTFSIDSVVNSDDFRNSRFVTYRVKDAIVDYFTELGGERPSVRLTNPDIYLNVHISHNECTISLDSSGESLHKRGYRVAQTEAPINEVLAAAMLLKAGWDGSKDFVDPMCGSGTLLIEAALIATNTAPGLYRKGYAFEKWNDFDADLLQEIYNDDSREREFTHKIYGADISPQVIEIARQNIKGAGMERYISLEAKSIQRWEEAPQNCLVVTNPPYGERLNPRDLEEIYSSLGTKLKHIFTGCDAWVISSSMEGFDKIGLKPSQKIALMNGSLECEFREYQIFGGTYSQHKKAVAEGKTATPQRKEKSKFAKRDEFKREGGKKEKTFAKSNDKKRYSFDDRKAPKEFKPKREAKRPDFKPQTEKTTPKFPYEKRELHGDEFVSKFVTFRQPSMLEGASSGDAKQFRKRKKKEE
ncbi:MAG: RNA methyltransferase [Bacteroidales bacterium]|nr:RNA methyltransferase [Bacteroidales bacterium]MBQ7819263.1 RNA methyltransferase [Bacteroidales bacterium]